MHTKRGLLYAALVVSSGACIESTLPTADDLVVGAIEGLVTDQAGVPVAAPAVSILLLTQPTGGSSRLLSQASFTANDAGRFVVTFQLTDEAPQVAVAAITVTAPPGRGLAGLDTTGIPVRLWRGSAAQDTAYVLFELPPR